MWGDYVHLQYASLVCIGVGAILGNAVAGPDADVQWDWKLISAAVILFISAVLADLRGRTVLDVIRRRRPNRASAR